ncbi:hypothetical protein H6P81_016336 [Aristolochia fimbriata]|uniref:Aminotransferase-like plant mobile domain-containing protein n=1 Tax=Aristolochia fimbriata TaxID=158543 RepID=A0AAV7E9B1_ARIFI|nr:hypothetical protein H6P81_016336 [Aristolochia fimbriata]
MSFPSLSVSFLGLVLSNVQIPVRGVRQECVHIGTVEGSGKRLLLPVWVSSALGGRDVHVLLTRATCKLWSRPVVNEDDQICFLPGVGEAPSDRFGPWEVRTIEVVSPRHIPFYFEWADAVLRTCSERLVAVDLVHAVRTSMFRNGCCGNVVTVFTEVWCSSTNSIFTREGELSISLWDMHRLGGLPITGGIFDETFPSVEDFSPGHCFPLPESIKYLILAYYWLAEPSEVEGQSGLQMSDWVSFWFRPKKGVQPSEDAWVDRARTSGLTSRDRSDRLNQPFAELGVPDALPDEVYLAAFLSLWLCRCILPMPGGMLRFTILKMACYLASGYKCNLAAAALAGLYWGLNSSSCGRVP